MAFHTGETVLYGAEGVCRITGTERRNIAGIPMEYYILQPVFNRQSRVLVPINNRQLTEKMRRVLSSQEIYDLIRSMPSDPDLHWEENETLRQDRFKEILQRGDRRELVGLIKTLYQHQQELAQKGKKLHQADERFFKDAEKKLYEEFAHVLNIEREQVLPFILEEIRIQERKEQE